jgi:hypothetical protein
VKRNSEEGVDSKETLPLVPNRSLGLRTTWGIACVLAGAETVRRGVACTTRYVLTSIASRHEGVDCVGRCATMKMSAHAFVGCKIARDLEKLDTEKHGHPCQLEGGPY